MWDFPWLHTCDRKSFWIAWNWRDIMVKWCSKRMTGENISFWLSWTFPGKLSSQTKSGQRFIGKWVDTSSMGTWGVCLQAAGVTLRKSWIISAASKPSWDGTSNFSVFLAMLIFTTSLNTPPSFFTTCTLNVAVFPWGLKWNSNFKNKTK